MDLIPFIEQLTAEMCSRVIKENDSFQVPKQLFLRNWFGGFSILFRENREERLLFFSEILSEEDCWEHANTIHRIKLNRRIAAGKMVKPQNSRGRINSLNIVERYLFACWCCLEEDIHDLFQQYKQDKRVDNRMASQMLIREFSLSEPLAIYWTRIVSGAEINTGEKNLYEYGLNQVFISARSCVEAVEFFWDKIKLEDQLIPQQKYEILINAIVAAETIRFLESTEITVFLMDEINPDWIPDLLRKWLQLEDRTTVSKSCSIFDDLKSNLRFDLYQKLFDHLIPDIVSEDLYYDALTFTGMGEFPEHYATAARQLFMHVWMKNGFDYHRYHVVKKQIDRSGELLVALIQKNYLEDLWAVMDKARPDIIKLFMKSKVAEYIASLFREKCDLYSLTKFEAYEYATSGAQNASAGSMEVEETTPSPTKRIKKD